MLRWRQKIRPPTPHSLPEYGNLVNMEQWRRYRDYDGGSLNITCLRAEDQSHLIVYADVQFLQLTSHLAQNLYIDATFKVCPRDLRARQLLTIMGRFNGTVGVQ